MGNVVSIAGTTPASTSHVCGAAGVTFRQANLFYQLEKARAFAEFGGKLGSFTPAVHVRLDTLEPDNVARFNDLTLSFRLSETPCSTAGPGILAGDTDATIVAHEYAHLITQKLQNEIACSDPMCPVTNPFHRTAFHDFADGYAAVLTGSPCNCWYAAKNLKLSGRGFRRPTPACPQGSR